MKYNSLATLLVGLLFVMALAVAFLSFTYVRNVRRMHVLQLQAAAANQNRAILRNLAAEAVEYSKRNPAMQNVLNSMKPGLTNMNQPAAKPPIQTK